MACAAKRESGYATNSAGGRGASAAGPEIPKEAGPRRRAQRRGAGDAGGIPTRSMRPHRRTDARPYAERGIAGGAGMRRSAANAPRATAGCIGPHAERTDAKSRAPLSGRPRRQSSDWRAGRTQRGGRFSRGSTVGPMQPADSGTASRSERKIDIICFSKRNPNTAAGGRDGARPSRCGGMGGGATPDHSRLGGTPRSIYRFTLALPAITLRSHTDSGATSMLSSHTIVP